MGVSQNKGYLFGGPHTKDYSILGSISGSPYFGKLPSRCCPKGPEVFEKCLEASFGLWAQEAETVPLQETLCHSLESLVVTHKQPTGHFKPFALTSFPESSVLSCARRQSSKAEVACKSSLGMQAPRHALRFLRSLRGRSAVRSQDAGLKLPSSRRSKQVFRSRLFCSRSFAFGLGGV